MFFSQNSYYSLERKRQDEAFNHVKEDRQKDSCIIFHIQLRNWIKMYNDHIVF